MPHDIKSTQQLKKQVLSRLGFTAVHAKQTWHGLNCRRVWNILTQALPQGRAWTPILELFLFSAKSDSRDGAEREGARRELRHLLDAFYLALINHVTTAQTMIRACNELQLVQTWSFHSTPLARLLHVADLLRDAPQMPQCLTFLCVFFGLPVGADAHWERPLQLEDPGPFVARLQQERQSFLAEPRPPVRWTRDHDQRFIPLLQACQLQDRKEAVKLILSHVIHQLQTRRRPYLVQPQHGQLLHPLHHVLAWAAMLFHLPAVGDQPARLTRARAKLLWLCLEMALDGMPSAHRPSAALLAELQHLAGRLEKLEPFLPLFQALAGCLWCEEGAVMKQEEEEKLDVRTARRALAQHLSLNQDQVEQRLREKKTTPHPPGPRLPLPLAYRDYLDRYLQARDSAVVPVTKRRKIQQRTVYEFWQQQLLPACLPELPILSDQNRNDEGVPLDSQTFDILQVPAIAQQVVVIWLARLCCQVVLPLLDQLHLDSVGETLVIRPMDSSESYAFPIVDPELDTLLRLKGEGVNWRACALETKRREPMDALAQGLKDQRAWLERVSQHLLCGVAQTGVGVKRARLVVMAMLMYVCL